MDLAEHQRWWHEVGAGELRSLLFYEWDPIGLSRLADAPLDEYDHYAGAIVRRLRAGTTADALAEALAGYAAEMGLESAKPPPRPAADRIKRWYDESTRAWQRAEDD